jgi:NAD(P)-dependent dehydrogenase (short-subunit alcohol dehydrogenase family)
MNAFLSDSFNLQDRIILVTGASRGIGRAVSLALARHGATVILSGRRVAELEQVYDTIKAAGGPEPAIAPLNLESLHWDECQGLIDQIQGTFGRLDGLLHNAAHLHGLTPLNHYPIEEWYRTLQVNLNAPFLLTRCCWPLLMASSDASVLFSSDATGRRGKAYYGAYGASKFALEGLMQIMAEETEANTPIRVNSLDPGLVDTALYQRIYPEPAHAGLPLPEAVCRPYLFLLGPGGRGLTGRSFVIGEGGPWDE